MTGRIRYRIRPVFFVLAVFVGPLALANEPAPYPDQLVQEARRRKLAEHSYWHRLLHFRRNLLDRYQSEVDDPKFFVAKKGRRSPASELEADLRAFFEPVSADPEKQSAQCQFPARYAWLKEQLQFDPARLPEHACERFDKWSKSMNADSVSLVFASYYMNNPASMYGHTFMRLNSKSHGAQHRLLDYTVNYAADVNTNNGILFAVLGLTGGYRGRFSTMPYYMKVQEYNNLESRDLWEYDLKLSSTSVRRLVEHLWEMGSGTIAYYFLNKNCSYQLLPLLEVAHPSLNLSRRFRLKAIPMDTLRQVLAQPGVVTNVQLRASHVSRLLEERSRLNKEEVALAAQFAKAPHPAELEGHLAPLPAKRQALVLDTAYDYFRYRAGFKRPQPPEIAARERELLLVRNRVSTSTGTVQDQEAEPRTFTGDAERPISPDHGHATGRIGLSYGFSNRSHFEELSLRPGLRDQDDPPLGYIPGSQLQMFLLRLRYDNDRRVLYPQQFTLVDLMSFSPWDPWVHHPSWKVNTGLAVANDLKRDPEASVYYALNTGSGISLRTPLSKDSLIYALAQVDAGVGGVFRDSYRLGGGGQAGILFSVNRYWRAHFDLDYVRYPLGNPGSAMKLRLTQGGRVSRQVEWRAKLERQNQYKEVLLSLLVYL
jgi:hypothetical protein